MAFPGSMPAIRAIIFDVKMREAFEFFLEHAGYSIPPGRAKCAISLARAERWAREEGAKITWEPDQLIHDSWMSAEEKRKPHVWEVCTITLGDVSLSLCGIVDADADYRRVVEAELASEIQVNFFEALANHILQL